MRPILAAVLVTLATVIPASAQPPSREHLVVGTKDAPPFSFQRDDGTWTGLSVELWRRVAEKLDVDFDFVERDLRGLVDGLVDGELDASVAALTMTAERERVIDFSHPFYTSGLGIAVARASGGSWYGLLRSLPIRRLLGVLASLFLVLLVAGGLLWIFERRRNAEQFPPTAAGVGDGFWWAAVTMTTVGYGDKAPRTLGGRAVAFLWMFASVFMISAFTATIASLLTTERLTGLVRGVEDLPRVRVGAVGGSTGERYLERREIASTTFATPADALAALAASRIDAVVHDAPILQHIARRRHADTIAVLASRFEIQQYAIGLPEGSPRAEAINRAILEVQGDDAWPALVREFVGE